MNNSILDLLFPRFCLGCQREGSFLCPDCLGLLEILENNYCLCEKNPLIIPSQQKTGKCRNCQDKKFSGLYFALPYSNKLTKNLIHNFKYPPYLKGLAKTLASILIEHFIKTGKNTNEIWQNSVLIPVPLDKNKLKTRDYNQCQELADELSKVLQIPVATDCLIKVKPTPAQMELSKKEREINLKNAFLVKNNEQILNRKVFLVDDVYTTGSTMSECAHKLRHAGAKQVWGIAIARESFS